MTQVTQQFKDMERDRIVREDRQETKRQEREAKAEEKREEREARLEETRLNDQRTMYEFMQKMMMMSHTSNSNNEKGNTIPDELTTGITERTSELTTSIITDSTGTLLSSKRSSSALSKDTPSNESEATTIVDTSPIKRNKTTITDTPTACDHINEQEEMRMETEQHDIDDSSETSTVVDTTMTDTGTNAESFTNGFINEQFPPLPKKDGMEGPIQQ